MKEKLKNLPILLTDKDGNDLKLGDVFKATRKLSRNIGKGDEMVLVFSIPQYRFGFMRKGYWDYHQKNYTDDLITDDDYLSLCLTPKNCKYIVKQELKSREDKISE